VPVGRLLEIARARGVALIEDAAQGTGGALGQSRLGSLGAYGVLSFGRGKGVTGGGGGALLLNDSAAVSAYRAAGIDTGAPGPLLRSLVRTAGQWLLARPSLYAIPSSLPFLALGETVYHPPHRPRRIASFSAALAQSSLGAEETASAIRRGNAERLSARLGHVPGLNIPSAHDANAVAGYLRLPLFAETATLRTRLHTARARNLGVLPSYPTTLSDLPGFGERVRVVDGLAGARALAAGLFTAPVHHWADSVVQEAIARLLADGHHQSFPRTDSSYPPTP